MMSIENPNPDPTPEPQNEPQGHGNAEAAKYRKERNAAREERDALRSRLDARDKQDVDRLASDRLADPADLWLSSSLDAMKGEDGTLDVAKASQEIEALLKAKPHYAKPAAPRPVDLHQGARGSVEPAPSFGQALLGTKRGH